MAGTSRRHEPQLYGRGRPPGELEAEEPVGERPVRLGRRVSGVLKIAIVALSMVLLLLVGGVIASFVLGPVPSKTVPQPGIPAAPDVAATPDAATTTEIATLGSPAPAAPNPVRYKSESVGDWFLVCGEAPERPNCFAQQQIMDASQKVIFTWSLLLDSSGTIRTLWRTPADVESQRGFIIDAGDGKPRPVTFESCDAQGCSVRGVLAPEFVKALEAAPRIVAAYVSSKTGSPVRIALSGRGLSDVLQKLSPTAPASR